MTGRCSATVSTYKGNILPKYALYFNVSKYTNVLQITMSYLQKRARKSVKKG